MRAPKCVWIYTIVVAIISEFALGSLPRELPVFGHHGAPAFASAMQPHIHFRRLVAIGWCALVTPRALALTVSTGSNDPCIRDFAMECPEGGAAHSHYLVGVRVEWAVKRQDGRR